MWTSNRNTENGANFCPQSQVLSKGKDVRCDRLSDANCALIMSQINCEPGGKLRLRIPSEMFRAAFYPDTQALLETFGIKKPEAS